MQRTIPTRVGNTLKREGRGFTTPDHPHARGEHGGRGEPECQIAGPSPRAWGTPPRARSLFPTRRTIPTRVGNTPARRAVGVEYPDHPHARGEHELAVEENPMTAGPSPRAWGTRSKRRTRQAPRRTIPTRVGNTRHLEWLEGQLPDHPHARGEHGQVALAGCGEGGPSPRAWGTRLR